MHFAHSTFCTLYILYSANIFGDHLRCTSNAFCTLCKYPRQSPTILHTLCTLYLAFTTDCPTGVYFLIHPLWWICDVRMAVQHAQWLNIGCTYNLRDWTMKIPSNLEISHDPQDFRQYIPLLFNISLHDIRILHGAKYKLCIYAAASNRSLLCTSRSHLHKGSSGCQGLFSWQPNTPTGKFQILVQNTNTNTNMDTNTNESSNTNQKQQSTQRKQGL